MIELLPTPMGSWTMPSVAFSGHYKDVLYGPMGPVPVPPVREVNWSQLYSEGRSERYGSKGPYRLINGKRWAPARSFRRMGWIVNSLGGSDTYRVYDQGSYWTRVSKESPCFPVSLDDYRLIHPQNGEWINVNETNRLNTELLIKIGRRQVNYGESLGEARETVRMLSGSVKTAVQALLAAKRGQWSRVPKILGIPRQKIKDGTAFRQGWLAYNYGWKPFFSDIYDSWQLLNKGFALQEPLIFSAVRQLKTKENLVTRQNSDYVLSGTGETLKTAKAFYKVSNSSINMLHQLGLINPLEVAWALQPYSFVVDWFLPVGNVLEALSARMGIDFVDGYYGVRRTSSATVRSRTNTATQKPLVRNFKVQTDYFSYERRPMANLPLPALYAKSPFSSSHLISAIALLGQLRR